MPHPINKAALQKMLTEAKMEGYDQGFKAGRESEIKETLRQLETPRSLDSQETAGALEHEWRAGYDSGRTDGIDEGKRQGAEACIVRLRNLFNL